ncbi:MAG: ATP-binding cassette domain-containing protein, partial [Actinobacteria bacterium]|nr:ATP-binding cassette domain-containing protein [Actinomycetota bacterium]
MLKFDHISFSYPGAITRALDGVSLCLEPGERVVLLGANGSGKSTLAKLANALLLPDAGCVEVDGRSTRVSESTRAIRTLV